MNKIWDKDLFQIQTDRGMVRFTSIFIPILLENILLNTLGTVNTAFLSNVSEGVVAAVGAANQMIVMFNVLITMIVSGSSAVITNYLGYGKEKETAEVSAAAVLFSSFVGLMLGILLAVFGNQLVSVMNLEEEIKKYAVSYFSIRALGLCIPAMTLAFTTVLRCYGVAITTVYVGIISNAVNLLGTILASRLFPDQLSLLTFMVALFCVLGQIAGLGTALVHFKKKEIPMSIPRKWSVLSRTILKILKIGVPNGVSGLGYTVSQTMSTTFVALLGTVALSGKVYFTNITSYCYLFSFSMGNACIVLVGRYCGAGEYKKAEDMCRQLCRLTVLLNLCLSSLLLLFRRPVLSLFTSEKEIFEMAFWIFVIDLIMEQSRAVSHVYERALMASGDNLFKTFFIVTSGLVNGVGLGYVLSIPCGLGLPGVWCGFCVDETVRAVVTYFRWKTGKWKKISKNIVQEKG